MIIINNQKRKNLTKEPKKTNLQKKRKNILLRLVIKTIKRRETTIENVKESSTMKEDNKNQIMMMNMILAIR